uniref:KRAB domain-containing protein n=1 Tax=Podarcis muralis TaxID=64176 RepID=A0A670KEE6_PODMU
MCRRSSLYVAVPFTEEDWALLDPDQRRVLHKEVKEENCGIMDAPRRRAQMLRGSNMTQ